MFFSNLCKQINWPKEKKRKEINEKQIKSASPHHTYSEDKKVNFSKVTTDKRKCYK